MLFRKNYYYQTIREKMALAFNIAKEFQPDSKKRTKFFINTLYKLLDEHTEFFHYIMMIDKNMSELYQSYIRKCYVY